MTVTPKITSFVRTKDNIRLAASTSGKGKPLVKASNLFAHLELDRHNPVWGHWVYFLENHFRLVRYDERGNGLSQREVERLDPELWLSDLEAVIDNADINEPCVLLGLSQGAHVAIQYAVKHPERVSHLVIYGGYAQSWSSEEEHRELAQREMEAMATLAELCWINKDSSFRRLYAGQVIPEASEEQLQIYDELAYKSVDPPMAARLLRSRAAHGVEDWLARVTVPTLVIHSSGDMLSPPEGGRLLAAGIPNAQFVELDSRCHIPMVHEPAWQTCREIILQFLGEETQEHKGAESTSTDTPHLSQREREILACLAQGLSDKEIGKALSISEKTVRNHNTNLFKKLQVSNRVQAAVKGQKLTQG